MKAPLLQALCGAAHGPHAGGAEFQAWAEAVDATEQIRAALRARPEQNGRAVYDLVEAAHDARQREDRAYGALREALRKTYRETP